MRTSITKSLLKLKGYLPRGSYEKISNALEDVSIQSVKNAFSGHPVSEEKMHKIFTEAKRIAAENIKAAKRAKRDAEAIINEANNIS